MNKFVNVFKGFHTFWLALIFAGGIWLGFILSFFWVAAGVCAVSLIGIWFVSRKEKYPAADALMILSFLCLGMVWVMPSCAYRVKQFTGQANEYVLKVSSLPQQQLSKNTFMAEISKVNDMNVIFNALVVDHTQEMQFSQKYKVTGTLAGREHSNTIFYTIWIKKRAGPISLPVSKMDTFVKDSTLSMLTVFKNTCSEEAFRFLSSVFLGRRELLGGQKQIFIDAGIAHLLAISGSNIGLTAGVLFFLLQFFYVPYRARLIISLIILYAYTVIVGANPPVIRAAIMYTIFALGFLSRRKINEWNSFGLAGLAILIVQPLWLFDAGFQLSFVSVAALILGFKVFDVSAGANALIRNLAYTFWATVFATVCVNPLVSYYFGRIYFVSVLHNVILIPFFTLILVINFLLLLCAPLGFIGQAVGTVLSILISGFMRLSEILGNIPLSYIDLRFNGFMVLSYYLVLAVIIYLLSKLLSVRKNQNEPIR